MKGKLIVVSALVAVSTGCSSLVGESMFVGDDEGRFLLSADRAGLQEFGKALNGLVVTGKATPDVQDSYFQNQQAETQVKMFRFKKPVVKK